MDGPDVAALAVEHGRIAHAGRLEEMPGWPQVDLGGGCVVAGFNDAHVHVWKVGHLLTSMLDLRGVEDFGDLAGRLRGAGREGWIQGRGFNEAIMRERRMPTRADLDAAVPDRPVFLTRTCGHIAVANSRALALAGIGPSTDAPAGGAIMRDARGEPTGILHETAMGLVGARVPPPSKGEYEEMIRAAARRHLAMGITTATDAGVTPEILDVYRAMTLPYRVNVMALRRPLGSDEVFPLPEKVDSPFLRVDTVKFIADGGLSGATAALREPYRHDGSRGLLRIDAEEMVELSREACEKGLRLAVHVIGDAAIDAALEALESLAVSVGLPLAPRLEHFGLPDAVQLRRARALGAVAVPQAIFIEALGVNFRAYLSESMLARAYPIRAMLDEGLGVALSSDAPVVGDESPLRGIRAALERRDDEGVAIAPEQAISLEEGFRAYTVGGAQASGDGDNRGRLAPGMWADFAVLSEDPRTADALARVKVEATFVGGERAF